jgi:amino acid permease
MGSGFLGLPAVFHDAGLILSPLLLIFFMWLSDATKDMMLEAMARQEALARLHERRKAKAEALVQLRMLRRRGASVPPGLRLQAFGPVRWRKRDFVVAHNRTFQVNELMHELWGRGAEIGYMVAISLYRECHRACARGLCVEPHSCLSGWCLLSACPCACLFDRAVVGSMWGYSSVFSASFAANVPVDFLSPAVGGVCDVEADWAGCAPHYHFYLAIFTCIAIPLACMEFREQAVVQVTMTIARIVVLVLLVATVLGGMGCEGVSFLEAPVDAAQRAAQSRLADGLGLISLLPVCLFAFIFHHSIPGVSEPVRNKAQLPGVFSVGFLITGLGYLVLATISAYFFGDSVKRQASLAWEGYVGCVAPNLTPAEAMAQRSIVAAAVASFILIFPALDVTSAYPLNAVTLANSLATAILPPAELVEMQASINDAAAATEEAKRDGRTWHARFCRSVAACCCGLSAPSDAAETRLQDPEDGIDTAASSRETDALVASHPAPAPAAAGASSGAAHPGSSAGNDSALHSSAIGSAAAPDSDDPLIAGGGPRGRESSASSSEGSSGSSDEAEERVYAPMVCGGYLRRGTGLKLLFRVVASGVPIIGGAFVADLGTILSWTGLVGVGIGLTVPALLQIRARQRCIEECRKLLEERVSSEERGEGVSRVPVAASPLIDPDMTGRIQQHGVSTRGLELREEPPISLMSGDVLQAEEEEEERGGGGAALLPASERGTDSAAVDKAVIEDDDVVEMLQSKLKEASAGGLGVELEVTDSAIMSVLLTPFDHSVLSGKAGAWGVVTLSFAMAVVVVVGLTALPAQ